MFLSGKQVVPRRDLRRIAQPLRHDVNRELLGKLRLPIRSEVLNPAILIVVGRYGVQWDERYVWD